MTSNGSNTYADTQNVSPDLCSFYSPFSNSILHGLEIERGRGGCASPNFLSSLNLSLRNNIQNNNKAMQAPTTIVVAEELIHAGHHSDVNRRAPTLTDFKLVTHTSP